MDAALKLEKWSEADADEIAGKAEDEPSPTMEAGRGDAAEQRADITTVSQPRTVSQQYPTDHRRQ